MSVSIVGIGVDSVEIGRVRKACERDHFVKRIFTEEEIRQFDPEKSAPHRILRGRKRCQKYLAPVFLAVSQQRSRCFATKKGHLM